MDKASAYGAEDCRFDPCRGRFNFFPKLHYIVDNLIFELLKFGLIFLLRKLTFVYVLDD